MSRASLDANECQTCWIGDNEGLTAHFLKVLQMAGGYAEYAGLGANLTSHIHVGVLRRLFYCQTICWRLESARRDERADADLQVEVVKRLFHDYYDIYYIYTYYHYMHYKCHYNSPVRIGLK